MAKKFRSFPSSSAAKTKRLGEKLAKAILYRTKKDVVVIALRGDLGAGKTTFAQGFARGLGIKKKPNSPTFVVMRRYPIRADKKSSMRFKNFYHIDAYRIKKPDTLLSPGFKKVFSEPENIVVVEWPENIKKNLPHKMIRIEFRHGKREHERNIKIAL
jgi:tRNA threonylcarbamoyladenosine biosynthesis protein TsaE